MENGLYEKVIDEIIKEKLKGKGFKETRSIDDSELPQVLATRYQKKIRETLAQISGKDEKIEFINRLNNTIGIGSFDYSDEKFRELLTVHENEEFYKELKELRPKTSISTSTLFIGYTEPTLESELRREIRTADEINLLVSFIKFSGLRLIYEDLVEFTKRNKLRVITTSYMGASDYKAILELSKLPNTGAKIFTGNLIPEGAEPISQAYAGHQFGHFTMLGDGRASLIGEHVTPKGERYDIQLKGSGRTRYSRGGDGRAALGPMLREYIISGGLHGLGIPTTRSLAVATTREEVPREDYLTGAILTRVASSHIRVGTFQFISAYGSPEDLRSLAEYTIQRHFPDISENEDKYLLLLKEVVTKQAKLIAKWQLIGFVHGVMNTDNMTISGESIDFGPCAFMDTYNPRTVFSSIDRQGRYAYGNQPDIGAWNLSRFADTLLPLIHDNQEEVIEIATEQVSEFYNIYNDSWLNGMRAKLGLFNREAQDQDIIEELFTLMEKYKADFTNTFRSLTIDQLEDMELFNTDEFNNWKSKWKNRLDKQTQTQEEIRKLMKGNNPSVIPRNHRVEEALMAAVERDDLSVMKKLLIALENPYAYTTHQEQYSTLPPSSYESYTTFCGT